jgi:hypothetical protein
LALLFLCGLGAAGCAPTTTYRNTAIVPAVRPVAWDGRAPEKTSLVLEGSLTHTQVLVDEFPQIGDTALLVPEWTAEGSALIALTKHVMIGLRGSYAAYAWAQPSATGTMPIPDRPATWGLGPEIRLTFPLDDEKRFALGVVGNVVSYQVPYAEWELTTGCIASPTCVDGYTLNHEETQNRLVYSLGLHPSYAFGPHGEYGAVFAVVTVTSGFQNDGFTDQPTQDGKLQSNGPIVILGGGYGFRYEALHAAVLAYRPTTGEGSPVDYGLGVQLAVGVDVDLTGGAKD